MCTCIRKLPSSFKYNLRNINENNVRFLTNTYKLRHIHKHPIIGVHSSSLILVYFTKPFHNASGRRWSSPYLNTSIAREAMILWSTPFYCYLNPSTKHIFLIKIQNCAFDYCSRSVSFYWFLMTK